MEKFIPYEKLSKKEKRKVDTAKRSTWGDLNPVTRKAARLTIETKPGVGNVKCTKPIPGLLFAFVSILHYNSQKARR